MHAIGFQWGSACILPTFPVSFAPEAESSPARALSQTKTPLKLTCGQQVLDEVAFTLVAVGLLEQVKRFFWSDQTRVLKGDEAFGGTRGRVPWAYQVLMLYATVTVRVSVMCELRSRS